MPMKGVQPIGRGSSGAPSGGSSGGSSAPSGGSSGFRSAASSRRRSSDYSRHRRPASGHSSAVDGNWGQWSPWSRCSVICGSGIRTRTRRCDNPPRRGRGKPCAGNSQSTENCRSCGLVICINNNVSSLI
ncbi:Thrombospondin-2 [Exaiptasia diaphana]|nr:Thrombospondin-2 [Exaiptasia diaphana]